MKDIKPLIKLSDEYVINETFSDDFTGTELDAAKWYPFYIDWPGRKLGRFVPENVSVQDGQLRLTAQNRYPVPPELAAAGYQPLTTAIVRSKTRILYGCFQMEFKVMSACLCNAFWLNDSLDPDKKYVPGYFSDEIDIFEIFGKSSRDAEDRFHCSCHRFATPYKEGIIFSGITSFSNMKYPNKVEPEKFHFCEGYHTATFLWTERKLEFYLDGRPVYEHANDNCHHPMYLNIDCEPLLDWCGRYDEKDLPATFSINYLRVWQKKAEND